METIRLMQHVATSNCEKSLWASLKILCPHSAAQGLASVFTLKLTQCATVAYIVRWTLHHNYVTSACWQQFRYINFSDGKWGRYRTSPAQAFNCTTVNNDDTWDMRTLGILLEMRRIICHTFLCIVEALQTTWEEYLLTVPDRPAHLCWRSSPADMDSWTLKTLSFPEPDVEGGRSSVWM